MTFMCFGNTQLYFGINDKKTLRILELRCYKYKCVSIKVFSSSREKVLLPIDFKTFNIIDSQLKIVDFKQNGQARNWSYISGNT